MYRTPEVETVDLSTANQEEGFWIPEKTLKIMVKSRNDQEIRFSFSAGDVKNNDYITIPSGSTGLWIGETVLSPENNRDKLYLLSPSGSDTAEILILRDK